MDAQSNPRYHMWNRLLGPFSTKEERQKFAESYGYDSVYEVQPSEEDWEKADKAMNNSTDLACINMPSISFGDSMTPAVSYYNCMFDNSPTKEDNMYNDTYNKEEAQTAYLNERLYDVAYKKYNELRKEFGITWNDYPKTVGEIRDRLMNGKFKFVDNGYKDDKAVNFLDIRDWFTWRTTDKDDKGYEAAAEKLELAKTETKDQFLIDYPTGLAALKSFEAQTFH